MSSPLTDRIVAFFDVPGVRLFVAHDPDGLLAAEQPSAALLEKQIHVVAYESSIDFRNDYESRYRMESEIAALVVLNRTDVHHMPYDVLSHARVVELSLAALFSRFAVDILRQLPYDVLEKLYVLQDSCITDGSERETIQFVAEKGYGISAETVTTVESLYGALLQFHLSDRVLPQAVVRYLTTVWRRHQEWNAIPIELLLRSRADFLTYMQRHWEAWISTKMDDGLADQTISGTDLALAYRQGCSSECALIPWDTLLVRTVVDDYFDMGLLEPVRAASRGEAPVWAMCGILVDESEYTLRRVDRMKSSIRSNGMPDSISTWGTLATSLGSLLSGLLQQPSSETLDGTVSELLGVIDAQFEVWLRANYDASLNVPYLPHPASVHQIASYLADERDNRRVALIIIDGMNWWQWHIMSRYLERQGFKPELISSVMACVPTITGISRSAIFAGRLPRSFYTLKHVPDEIILWQRFWSDNGLSPEQAYLDVVGPTSTLRSSVDRALPVSVRAFGAVIPKIDELIHSDGLSAHMFAAAEQSWLEQGQLTTYLSGLLDAGYDVYVTADHGNTVARGIGPTSSGDLAEKSGKRARIFPLEQLRNLFVEQHSEDTTSWNSSSLPDDTHVALCRGDGAFAPKGQTVNCHGGISLMEVMVPFVRIKRSS